MDVSKAKTIIIVLLAAFNIFLLVNNLVYHDAQGVSVETLENTEKILEHRGVTLECQIPAAAGDSHRLEYNNGGLDRESIAAGLLGETFDIQDSSIYVNDTKKLSFSGDAKFVYTDSMPGQAVNITGEADAKDSARKFLEKKGLPEGKYVLDKSETNKDGSYILYYIEKYEDQLLFDNYYVITLTDKGVTRLEYQKYKIKGFSAENVEQPEVYQTLLTYFKDGSDIVIIGIESGYKLVDEASMGATGYIEPLRVWRVMVKGKQEPIYISPHDISL